MAEEKRTRAVEWLDAISRECFRSFAGFPGATLLDGDGVFGVTTRVPMTFFNGIASTRLDPADVHGHVERVAARFRTKGRGFRWWITPLTQPANLAGILPEHGFKHVFDSAGMTADLTSVPLDIPPPPGVVIERVTSLDGLRDWVGVFRIGFDRPPQEIAAWLHAYAQFGFGDEAQWEHFVAYVDGQAIATTSSLLAGGLVGIYHVVTLDGFRGRGIGAAVTRTAMQHAHARGAKVAALQSSEMGLSVYRSLGFVEHCRLTLYASD